MEKENITKKAIVSLVIVLFVACLGYIVITQSGLNKDVENNAVEVYVNGEALYTYEVDDTLKVNPGLERETIIENTIDEMLIIQYAKEKQIEITDEEVACVLKAYQEYYPEIYKDAMDGYGEEELKSGIKNKLLLNAAIEEIMNEPLYKINFEDDDVWQYLSENGIDPAALDEDDYEEAKKLYVEAKKRENKKRWISNARKAAEIVHSEE